MNNNAWFGVLASLIAIAGVAGFIWIARSLEHKVKQLKTEANDYKQQLNNYKTQSSTFAHSRSRTHPAVVILILLAVGFFIP